MPLSVIQKDVMTPEEEKSFKLNQIISKYELLISKEMHGYLPTAQEQIFSDFVSENLFSTAAVYNQYLADVPIYLVNVGFTLLKRIKHKKFEIIVGNK